MKIIVNYGLECNHFTKPEFFEYDDDDLAAMYSSIRPICEMENCDECNANRKILLIRVARAADYKPHRLNPTN